MNDQRMTQRPYTGCATSVCNCCANPRPLVAAELAGQPGRWATCSTTGMWHENRGDGVFTLAAGTPPQIEAIAPNGWATGGSAPTLAPGVHVDLSRESYA